MRKSFYYFMFLAGAAYLNAQTIVGTEPQTKKVLLEKFTGINCGACPGGDAKISELVDLYGDDLSVFAHHTFSTSPGDIIYEITESGSIAQQSIATGYPAGSINRKIFTDYQQNPGGTAMGRTSWQAASDLEFAEDAYVNIGTELKFDVEFNKFIVNVEMYYTGTPTADQRLNVALVQSHILGPQAGGGAGDEYEHNHMVREMVTGQWGEVLTGANQGAFLTKTYEVEIPAAYGPVATIPENMEVVVFITEGTTTVANSAHAKPVKFVHYGLNPGVRNKGVSVCGDDIVPKIELFNFGNNDLTEVKFEYIINGTTNEYTWNGNIETFGAESVSLPSVPFTSLANNSFLVKIVATNGTGVDENLDNNEFELLFEGPENVQAFSHLELKLDGYGSEIKWSLVDEEDNTYYSGGPYEDGSVEVINEYFELSEDKCYRFLIEDSEGNGLEGGQNSTGTYYPAGHYKFTSGTYVKEASAFGEDDQNMFSIDLATVGVAEVELSDLKVYPNPSTEKTTFTFDITLANPGEIEYTVTDNLGRLVIVHQVGGDSGKNGIVVDHNLSSGVYYLNVKCNDKTSMAKFSVQ